LNQSLAFFLLGQLSPLLHLFLSVRFVQESDATTGDVFLSLGVAT
jgi:hypothetical protein